MKTVWRRILILSAILVLAMSAHALADETQYSAKTVYFPNNNYNAGWSNQFTVYANTNISVGINFYNTSSGISNYVAAQINKKLTYVLENVKTGKQYFLTKHIYDNNYQTSYEESMLVPAGTYSFGVYYKGSYTFALYFRITGSGGIDVPDKIEIVKGTSETIGISQKNSDGTVYYVPIKSAYVDDEDIAEVTKRDNSSMPPKLTIKGKAVGTTTLTVKGQNGTVDTMTVAVVKKKSSPTLKSYDVELNAGDTYKNKVNNKASGAKVTWTTNKPKVATVTSNGKIKGVSHGTATITATTVKNGQTYVLACQVTVNRADPEFIVQMKKIYPAKKKIKITITNKMGVPITVYKKATLLDWPDYDETIRSLQLWGGRKTIKVAANKKKTFYFNIKGGKFSMGNRSITDLGVQFKVKIDGLKYYVRCTHDKHLGEFIRTKNLSTGKWEFSYSAYGV